MEWTVTRGWVRMGAALLGLVGAGAGVGLAQMGEADGPEVAMGAGRMVRGTVTVAATASAKDRLTVKTEEGEVYTVAVTPNTQVRKGREPMKLADVRAGDGVGAMGEVDAATKTVHALFLGVIDAAQVREMRAALGKTWIAGTVKAIDEVRLTVLRADGVTQVIEVDEDTSFRRGGRELRMMFGGAEERSGAGRAGEAGTERPGAARAGGAESMTLPEVKVGNSVAGPGVVKHGVFVAKELAVGDPAARRRRGAAGAALVTK